MMCAGGLFHYNYASTTYSIAKGNESMYKDEESNPLINDFGIYILANLSTFQNMQDYTVTAETDIDEYVREAAILHDGTKIYRFSRELLAYIETCVAFSPYYRQDDPRTVGPMDKFYTDALSVYEAVSYKDLHNYLARRFNAWYTLYKPTGTRAIVAAEPELVELGGAAGGAPPAKKPRFSLETPCQAPPAAPPPAAAPPAASTAGADGGNSGSSSE